MGKERIVKSKEKDIAEKVLEDYNEIFADIVNGLVFKGKQVISPDSLLNTSVKSQYKADDNTLHEEERDVAKIWKPSNIKLVIMGLENQTKPEKYFPLRAMAYDGASYKSQLSVNKDEKPCPVVTLVLYFGNEHWNYPKNLKSVLDIPDGFEEYVNEYKINVFEIAWLTDEEISRFKSDFKVVANFFSKIRRDPNYVPDDLTEIEHVDAVLKLLSVVTGDQRYVEIRKEGVANMCDVAERLEQKGRVEGLAEGRAEAENNYNKLILLLSKDGRLQDITKAASDKKELKKLFKEYNIGE